MIIRNTGSKWSLSEKVLALGEVRSKTGLKLKDIYILTYLAAVPDGAILNWQIICRKLGIPFDRWQRAFLPLKNSGFVRVDTKKEEIHICWGYLEAVEEQVRLGVYDEVQRALAKQEDEA